MGKIEISLDALVSGFIAMTERWVVIPGHEGFEASTSGHIRNAQTQVLRRERPLKGYPGVSLTGEPKNKCLFTVHSLVALAFIGPRPPLAQINHKDGNTSNNAPDNLEYVSCRENIHHSWNVLGNDRFGSRNPAAKITEEIASAIRREYIPGKAGKSIIGTGYAFLAKKYGVTKRSIINVLQSKTWDGRQSI